jgi:hypothetical protein
MPATGRRRSYLAGTTPPPSRDSMSYLPMAVARLPQHLRFQRQSADREGCRPRNEGFGSSQLWRSKQL